MKTPETQTKSEEPLRIDSLHMDEHILTRKDGFHGFEVVDMDICDLAALADSDAVVGLSE